MNILSKINTYNKDLLVKDFLIGKIQKAISDVILTDGDQHKLILKWWTALRKFFDSNYPRFTWDVDYKSENIDYFDDKFLQQLTRYLNHSIKESIWSQYNSIQINPAYITKKWIKKVSIRFNKILWKQDYVIWIDIAPIEYNEHIAYKQISASSSKIDEILWKETKYNINVEDLNESLWHKLFASLHRIWASDKIWSIMSRHKDLFDIRYFNNIKLSNSQKIVNTFIKRYNLESQENQRIVKNQIYNIIDSKNYFENLISLIMYEENNFNNKDIFYKYTKWLDKNYIISDIKNIYNVYVALCQKIANKMKL